MFDPKQHYENSSLRENIIEHLFVGSALRALWQNGVTGVEILRSEFDAYGYDLVVSYGNLVRHVQLKSGKTIKAISVSNLLAEKPSGCVVFIVVNDDLEAVRYLLFSGQAGSPLPSIADFKQTKRTTPKSDGKKPSRIKHRTVTASNFTKYESLTALLAELLSMNMDIRNEQ